MDLANRRSYVTVPGTGIIFSTIVYGTNGRAAYVPAYTISCKPPFWDTGCNIFRSPEFRVLSAVLIFVGILRAYFGSFFTLLGVFIDSFVLGIFTAFFVLYYGFPNSTTTAGNSGSHMPDPNFTSKFVFSAGTERTILLVVGFTVAIIFTFIWHSMFVPRKIVEIVANIIVGYLLASLTVFIADDVRFKASGYWYEVIFLAMIVLTFVLFPPCYNASGIVLSATWGSFAIVQGILFLVGPHLSFIVINSIRYVSVKEYRYAQTTPQLNAEGECWGVALDSDLFSQRTTIVFRFFADWGYVTLWFTLLLTGIVFQMKVLNKPSDSYLEERDVVYANEQTPLISRWTHGSDDVFESPTTNERFLSQYRSTVSSRNSL